MFESDMDYSAIAQTRGNIMKFMIVMSVKDENNIKMFYYIDGKRKKQQVFELANLLTENQRERKEIEENYLTRLTWFADWKEEE